MYFFFSIIETTELYMTYNLNDEVSNSKHVEGNVRRFPSFCFFLPESRLISVGLSGRSSDRPSRYSFFFSFPLSYSKCWDVSKIQVATAYFSCSPPHSNLWKSFPCFEDHQIILLPKLGLLALTCQSKFRCPYSLHNKVFNFKLLLSVGWAGGACKPLTKLSSFFPLPPPTHP